MSPNFEAIFTPRAMASDVCDVDNAINPENQFTFFSRLRQCNASFESGRSRCPGSIPNLQFNKKKRISFSYFCSAVRFDPRTTEISNPGIEPTLKIIIKPS